MKLNALSQSLNPNVNVNNSVPLGNTITKMEKENLFLRIIKKVAYKDTSSQQHLKEEVNICFIEKILKEITKEILSSPSFEKEICEKIDNQPLSLYGWTDDSDVSTLEHARKSYLDNLYKEANNSLDNSLLSFGKKLISSPVRTTHRHSTNTLKYKKRDYYDEEEDYNIQDKYMEELLTKYKLSIPEVNEKLIVVNEDSRKIISDVIMENTIYNIVSEAVYGETDLTEKPRIYFFSDKKP